MGAAPATGSPGKARPDGGTPAGLPGASLPEAGRNDVEDEADIER